MREIIFKTPAERMRLVFDVLSGKRKPLAAGMRLIVRPKQRRTMSIKAKPPKLAKQVRAAKSCVAAQSLGAAATSGDDPPDGDGEPPPGHDNAAPRRKGGASKNWHSAATKNQQGASSKPPSKTQVPQALYSGQTLRGYLRGTEALDLCGNSLGTFKNRSDAVSAVLAASNKGAIR